MTDNAPLSSFTDDEWLEVILRGIQEAQFAGIELPRVPPEGVRTRSSGVSDVETSLRSGFKFYQIVKNYMVRYGVNLAENSCILDFGCGWGRITRFFMKDVLHENLYGIDVDSVVIEACRQTLPHGHFAVSHRSPPSDFPSANFDLIYAWSVFSHLPGSLHLKWIAEFERILKPGGVLVVTTLGRSFISICRDLREKQEYEHPWQRVAAESFPDLESALADYDSGKLLYSANPSPDYGLALIPSSYVKTEWTRFLEFCDFIDDPSFLHQALVVMKKDSLTS